MTPPPSVDGAATVAGAGAGLTSEEANRRLRDVGPNAVPFEPSHPWRRLLATFWAPVPWMLEVAIALELILGKILEAAIIAALLAFNSLVSFAQEQRARTALALLRQRLSIVARVRRDGHWQRLPASDLVPGDAIHLRVGDLVPADTRLVDGQILVDRSALTGEALPIELALPGTAHAGTVVQRGEATGEVLATGTRTAFGKTAELVRTATAPSHIERTILRLVRPLAALDLVLVAVVLIYAWQTRLPPAEVLPFALVLLIASVPIALPATFTLATALGAGELADRGVLVTRLAAIEEAAGMDVLCADKTGTLTEGQLRLSETVPYPPHTAVELLRLAVFASDEATQDPLDLAILAATTGPDREAPTVRRLRFIPFEPATKRSEAVVRLNGTDWHVVKGAPEVVARSVPTPPPALGADVARLAANGLRVLAVAAGPEGRVGIAGLLGFHDPPRPESRALIQRLQALGVRVVMVTGDHLTTALAVAELVGLDGRPAPAGGSHRDQPNQLLEATVFADVYPEEKFALVDALQRAGHVVGMTGDGVNDAPALRQAEVGIAVANATDVAKAAASLVLTKPGLGNVVAGIETSRRIYQRMQSYALNMSIRKLELPLFLSLGLIFSGGFVISPRLLLLLLFANDFVTMALATDRVVAASQPTRWRIRSLLGGATGVALPLLIVSFGVFWVGRDVLRLAPAPLQTVVFVWLVFSGQATVYLVRARDRFWRPRPSGWLLASTIGDVAIVSVLAIRGWLMAPIAPPLVGALLALAVGFGIVLAAGKHRAEAG